MTTTTDTGQPALSDEERELAVVYLYPCLACNGDGISPGLTWGLCGECGGSGVREWERPDQPYTVVPADQQARMAAIERIGAAAQQYRDAVSGVEAMSASYGRRGASESAVHAVNMSRMYAKECHDQVIDAVDALRALATTGGQHDE